MRNFVTTKSAPKSMAVYRVVIGEYSSARHNAVVMKSRTISNSSLVCLTNLANQKSMITQVVFHPYIPTDEIHLCSFTQAKFLQVTEADTIRVTPICKAPLAERIVVAIQTTTCMQVLNDPELVEQTYIAPNYIVKVPGRNCYGRVIRGTGLVAATIPTSDATPIFSPAPDATPILSSTSSPVPAPTSSSEPTPVSKFESTIHTDFKSMGMGGLDVQMNLLVQQVLVSRVMGESMRRDYQVKDIKGILLYGPPGTGKTLIARKIGCILKNSNITQVNGPELASKWIGETEKNIRDIFEKAKLTPSKTTIIIFDEIDAIGMKRGEDSDKYSDKALTQLLTMIDGLNSVNNVLVIGITNRKEVLDPALVRPGRLEFHLEIPAPTEAGRQEILDLYLNPLREKGLVEDIDTKVWAQRLHNYTGANIESLIARAKNLALLRNCKITDTTIQLVSDSTRSPVTSDDLEQACASLGLSSCSDDPTIDLYTSTMTGDLQEKISQMITQIEQITLRGKPCILPLKATDENRQLACHIAKRIGQTYSQYTSYDTYLTSSSADSCRQLQQIYTSCLEKDSTVLILDCLNDLGDRCVALKVRHLLERPIPATKRLVILHLERGF